MGLSASSVRTSKRAACERFRHKMKGLLRILGGEIEIGNLLRNGHGGSAFDFMSAVSVSEKCIYFLNVRERYEQKFFGKIEHFQRHNSITVSLPNSYHSVPRTFMARGTSNRR